MGLKEKLIRRGEYVWELPAGTVVGQKVPVIVYISDTLYQLLEDEALQQAVNAACLPGVEKAIYVMPDVHVGYGFPVGGVMATNTKDGIISPGSVGYDINCLPEGAEILSEYGYRFKIEKYSGENLVGIKDSFEPRSAPVLLLFKRKDNKLLKIRTSLGYEILLTPDHPILTKKGMKEARFIFPGNFVAVYPFRGVEYEEAPEFTILESTGNQIHDRELKKRGLLPLKSSNEKLPVLLRLLGYLTGRSLRGNRIRVLGSKEDLQKVKEDIERLGFSVFFKGNYLYISSKSFLSLIKSLRGSSLLVPEWLFKLPKWMKRLYLAGLFGAKMNTSQGFKDFSVSFSIEVRRESIESGEKFIFDIKQLLAEFGLKTGETEEFIQGSSVKIGLSISTEEENLIKFFEELGYEYSTEKSRFANLAAAYLRYRQKARSSRKVASQKVGILKAVGMDFKATFEEFSTSVEKDLLSFEEWVNSYAEGFIVWDKVEEIQEQEYEGWVYDFSLNTSEHNFVAQNFVVSNCGVRLIATNLKAIDIAPKIKQIMNEILRNVPAGVGSTSDIKLSESQLKEVLVKGAGWAVNYGFGFTEDLKHIEGYGALPNADPDKASKEAYERGSDELGTVGSGNHFVEIQAVEEIYDEDTAKKLGLWKGQVTIMVHSGSRGFGHQVCTDYLKVSLKAARKYGIELPDPQLACVPFSSPEGQDYFKAMNAAANYAFANRQILGFKTADTLRKLLGMSWEEFGYRLIYDHAHNIAKVERHKVGNKEVEVVVHRKGATRAFPPYNPEIPPAYRDIGQPVIIPGDMGRASYLLVGQSKSMDMSFGTACHGAGRVMSRRKAKQFVHEQGLEKVLGDLVVVARGKGTIMEEIPQAYKDVSEVVRVIDALGIAKVVAKLKPLGTLKG